MDITEKRKYTRYRSGSESDTLNIEISSQDNQIAVSPNSISQNGCDFLLDTHYPVMTRLSLSIDLSDCKIRGKNLAPVDKYIKFEGTVVRIEEKKIEDKTFYHTAVFFGELPSRISELLKSLFDEKRLKPEKNTVQEGKDE